jgi:hypothetical protein
VTGSREEDDAAVRRLKWRLSRRQWDGAATTAIAESEDLGPGARDRYLALLPDTTDKLRLARALLRSHRHDPGNDEGGSLAVLADAVAGADQRWRDVICRALGAAELKRDPSRAGVARALEWWLASGRWDGWSARRAAIATEMLGEPGEDTDREAARLHRKAADNHVRASKAWLAVRALRKSGRDWRSPTAMRSVAGGGSGAPDGT